MTPAPLVALCLALWAGIAQGYERAGDAAAIAQASAQAVLEDAEGPPATSSHDEDLADLAYLAVRESSLRADAVGDRGLARGPWQLHGACGRRSLLEQARCELVLLHEGARRCPAHPMTVLWGAPACHAIDPLRGGDVELLAAKRERRTRELLVRALGEVGAAEMQSR